MPINEQHHLGYLSIVGSSMTTMDAFADLASISTSGQTTTMQNRAYSVVIYGMSSEQSMQYDYPHLFQATSF